jgi:hypothetical protein
MNNLDGPGYSRSLCIAKDQWANPHCLLAMLLAHWRRVMRAIKEHNASRDQVWPRNYSCWIRAP